MAKVPVVQTDVEALRAAVESLVALVRARDGNTASAELGACRDRCQVVLDGLKSGYELPRY